MSPIRRYPVAFCLLGLLAGLTPVAAQYPDELTAADELLRKGRPEQALEALADIGEPAEDFVGLVRWHRAVALAQQEEWDEAVCLWSRGARHSPYLRDHALDSYPAGEELARRVHQDAPVLRSEDAERAELPVPTEETAASMARLGDSVSVFGLVTPEGRWVVHRVDFDGEVPDEAERADAVIAEACRWRFAPATLAGEPVALRRRVTAEGLEGRRVRIDLATVDVHSVLRPVRDALAAGRYRQALATSRATARPQWRADLAFVPHALALEAFAAREAGDEREALCAWFQAVHLDPELDGARFGTLPPFAPPREQQGPRQPLRVDEVITHPEVVERRVPRRSVDLDGIPSSELSASTHSVVDPEGRVAWLWVESEARPEVLLALVDSACRWIYRPATRDGEPIVSSVRGHIFLAPPAD